ncbi:MAG: cysteine desulfurase [Clostridiales bacterium]|nr:cysteine desulfurase [Clostridiales bacterium]
MKPIYLDYAATTPVDKSALSAARPYMNSVFFNPSSMHSLGRKAYAAVEKARQKVARAINAAPENIIFTSCGTEAIQQAMLCFPYGEKKKVIVSAIEHDSVTSCANAIIKRGMTVEKVMPTPGGIITAEALKRVIDQNTALVCVMTVNNQTGAVQPIKELAEISHSYGAAFFTDAVQAVCTQNLDVTQTNVDMLAASAHKFYSLKGCGFLYRKNAVKLDPLMLGGRQEYGLRAGTENVPSIVAMGEAIERAVQFRREYIEHVSAVEKAFFGALTVGEKVFVENGTDGISSVVFDGVNGGRLAIALSMSGVCCSVGSACSSGSATPPPTLVAMGVKSPECAVRFSFGKSTTTDEAVRAAHIVNLTVDKLKKNG